MTPTLKPRSGPLYVVRWIRLDGRNAKHRYFRRRTDAARFLKRLQDGGWDAAMFHTVAGWREIR